MTRNNIPVAAYTLIALLVSAVVTVPVLGNEGDSGNIRKILDAANAEASNKLQKLQQEGIPIPVGANSFYSAALVEYKAATDALDSGDIASAEMHAIKAMDLFRNVFDLLPDFEQDSRLQDIELVNEIDEDISNSQRWADDLERLASANDVSVSFSDYDLAINASLNALSEGELTEAKAQLALAQELLEEIHDDIQAAVDGKKSGKVREFALKIGKRLSKVIAELKEKDSPDLEFIIEELERLMAELENTTDIDAIIGITDDSGELQTVIDDYNTHRIENFDDEYADIEEDIAALYATAQELNITIESSEIDELLSTIRENIENGEEDEAAEALDRLDSLLDEIEDIVEEFLAVIEDIEEIRNMAIALRSYAESNGEPLEQIDQAISLLEEADLAVLTAAEIEIASETINDVHAQLELASELAHEAERILDEIGDLGYDQERFDSIMQTITEYEDWANELGTEAAETNNTEAIEVIDEALSLIEQARNAALEGDAEQAEFYLHDAQIHLENAEAILEAEEEHQDDEVPEEDEDGLVQSLGEHSRAIIDPEHGAWLQVEIAEGDLEDGIYNVLFACTSPEVGEEFADELAVWDGYGWFETELALAKGTYSGCEVNVGDLSAAFPPFTVVPEEEDVEEEGEEEHEDEGSDEQDDEEYEEESEEEDDEDDEGSDDNSGENGEEDTN